MDNLDAKKLFEKYLATAVQNDASDIHFTAHKKPVLRIKNKLVPVGENPLSGPELKQVLYSGMTQDNIDYFEKNKELDFGLQWPKIGRFRVNVFTALGEMEAVLRVVRENVMNSSEIGMPEIINQFAELHDGLILVSGATGSGKSTTLAAMVDHVNRNFKKRIITVEDPVELIHINKQSVISQREVGQDTFSYGLALKSLMRQNPDVILIGEIRDKETADSALQAAQTGHLVLSTVHASSAPETIERFAGLYPMEERPAVKRILSYTLKGVIAQRLIVNTAGSKMPIMEIMASSKRVQDSIMADANDQTDREPLEEVIRSEKINGMHTLDQYLLELVINGVVTPDKAVQEAVKPLWVKQNLQQRGVTVY